MRAPCLNLRVADLLTVEETARVLKISVATLWRWKAQGDVIAHSVLGRTVFERAQIEALARKRFAAG